MFDIGFSELFLIGIVALVVFGPEELPRVARTVGHLLGKLRRYVSDVKSDISREMEAADMKNLVGDLKESAASLQDSFNAQARSFQAEMSSGLAGVEASVRQAIEVPQSEPTAALPDNAAQQASEPDLFSASSTPATQAEPDLNQLDLFGQPVAPNRDKKE